MWLTGLRNTRTAPHLPCVGITSHAQRFTGSHQLCCWKLYVCGFISGYWTAVINCKIIGLHVVYRHIVSKCVQLFFWKWQARGLNVEQISKWSLLTPPNINLLKLLNFKVLNIGYLNIWSIFFNMESYSISFQMPFALYRKTVHHQPWSPSAARPQALPWSCSALWAKQIPPGTSLSPRWASAQPWLWFTWELKETPQLRWRGSAQCLSMTCTFSVTWHPRVTSSP